jgi:hypothetical protein
MKDSNQLVLMRQRRICPAYGCTGGASEPRQAMGALKNGLLSANHAKPRCRDFCDTCHNRVLQKR